MSDIGLRVIPPVATTFIRSLHKTLRIRHWRAERIEALNQAGNNYILTLWHAQLLMMSYARFSRPLVAMISQHRDGELIARTLESFHVQAARGSTTRRGSAALREMVRLAREGANIGFTPDGPRGPRRIAQSGVITAAQLTERPILPAAFVAKKKSFSARGIASRCLIRSVERSFFTASRSRFPAGFRRTTRNAIARMSNACSLSWPNAASGSSTHYSMKRPPSSVEGAARHDS